MNKYLKIVLWIAGIYGAIWTVEGLAWWTGLTSNEVWAKLGGFGLGVAIGVLFAEVMRDSKGRWRKHR